MLMQTPKKGFGVAKAGNRYSLKLHVKRKLYSEYLTGSSSSIHIGTFDDPKTAEKFGKKTLGIVFDENGQIRSEFLEKGLIDVDLIQKKIGYDRGY